MAAVRSDSAEATYLIAGACPNREADAPSGTAPIAEYMEVEDLVDPVAYLCALLAAKPTDARRPPDG